MTRARRNGMLWLLLCSGIFIGWGSFFGHTTPSGMADFKPVYYAVRCLIQHHDPYKANEVLRAYQMDGGKFPSDPLQSAGLRQVVALGINLPASLLLLAPFTLLGWGPAHVLWMVLVAGNLILASALTWDMARGYAPRVSLFLVCIVLANCGQLFACGNLAGIAVSFCVIAVWCFVKERWVSAGILCLAVGLAVKPHDVGLVWLYFLLAGGTHRKRALQTLVVTIVLSIPAVLWVTRISPNWVQELHSNLATISAHGSLDDVGPAGMTVRKTVMIIDLQTVISVFRDDPAIYNPASYLICGALLLVWIVGRYRSRSSPAKQWLALAALAALSMLPTYHRQYDAKLLLLTIPACAMLWAEGGRLRWPAFTVTAAAVILTADFPLALLLILIDKLHLATAALPGQIATVVLARPIPLILLVTAIFYLWVYMRSDSASERTAPPEANVSTERKLKNAVIVDSVAVEP